MTNRENPTPLNIFILYYRFKYDTTNIITLFISTLIGGSNMTTTISQGYF